MDETRWRLIKRLFLEALDYPPDRRSTFFDGLDAPTDVKQEVIALLDEESELESFLAVPCYAMVPGLLDHFYQPLPVGTRMGSYELIGLLGKGGMGTVDRARHVDLQKEFALKTIHTFLAGDPSFTKRFHEEARILGRMRHRGIVSVTDFGTGSADASPYIVMERLAGRGLDEILAEAGALPPARALRLLADMAEAIDYAHEAGVLHGDLKPGNVRVVSDDTGERAVLLDFGIAMLAGVTPRENRRLMGTSAYMAPEVKTSGQEAASPASDLFALGVIAAKLVTGKLPDGQHLPPDDGLAPEVKKALQRNISPRGEERPPSAAALAGQLALAFEDAAVRRDARSRFVRSGVTLVPLSIVSAIGFWLASISIFAQWEAWPLDLRFRFLDPTTPDPGITLITIDDRSLTNNPRSLATLAGPLSSDLRRVLDSGAKTVAVDLMLPESWSRSPEFAALVLDHHERLVLAALAETDTIIGPEAVGGLITGALGEDAARDLFGFIMVNKKPGGMLRRNRLFFDGRHGQKYPSLAMRAAHLFAGPSIAEGVPNDFIPDFSVDWTRYTTVSLADLDKRLTSNPDWFANRLVLVGAEFTGSGDQHHAVPHPQALPGQMSGLRFQALSIQSLLEHTYLKSLDRVPFAAVLGLVMALPGWFLLAYRKMWPGVLLLVAVMLIYIWAGWVVFARTKLLTPLFGPVVFLLVYMSVVFVIRSSWNRFSVQKGGSS